MTHQTAAASLLILLLLTSAAHAQTPSDPLAPFGWFKDMAGHCWSGTYPDGKTSDTQCYSLQFGRLLRGTIELSGLHGSQPVANFQGDSVYAWNPKTNRAQYTFWASDGTYGSGEMYREGDQLIFPPTGNADSPSAMRSVWRRVDADSFIVAREKRQGDTWSKVFEVTYRRREAQHPNAGADASEVNRVADEYVSAYRGADWRRMSKLLAEDVAFEDPTFRLKQSNKAGVMKMMQDSEGGFSDISLEVNRRIIAPPYAVLEVAFNGRPRSKEGEPPREFIRARGVTILGVENGSIKTWSDYFDFRSFAEQMRLPVCKAPQGGG